MSYFEFMESATADSRDRLLRAEVIADCLAGRVSLETYTAFLCQAYHHVSHTVPLLMACGARLQQRLAWLLPYVVSYIDEEFGHELWIANDIQAAGGDAERLLAAGPNASTELMVSYAYDTIARRNPVGFFGMVYVLEGTSVAIASYAADIIQCELGLPDSAFTYLRSHGAIDLEHMQHFREIVDGLESDEDRAALVHGAQMFFRLYGDVFDELPRAIPGSTGSIDREVA